MENKLINLSDNKVKVIIGILRVISEEDKEYTLTHISACINMSTRSAQRYINVLDNLIKDYNVDKGAHFDMTQNSRGVRLAINRSANISFLISYLFQKDDTINLLLSLLTQEYASINDYNNASFIGSYAVNKSIDIINSELADFDLEVDRKNFAIKGSEASIRFFMNNVFWLVYRCDDFPDKFYLIDFNKLKNDVSFLIENLDMASNNPAKERDIMFRISTLLLRFQKKCFVKLNDYQKKLVPIYQNQYGNPTLYETVEIILNNHHIFDIDEIYYLILSLLNNNLTYTSKTIKMQLIKHHQRNNLDPLKATTYFLEKFQEDIYEIPYDKMEYVFDFIFRSHLIADIHYGNFRDHQSHIFDEIKSQSPEYVEQIKEIVDTLKNTYQFSLFNNENYLLNRYVMLKYFLNLKLLYKKPIKVKLHTNFPGIYEEYIKGRLAQYFKDDYKIQFIEDDIFQESDLTLTFFKMDDMDEKTVNVSYPFNPREITYLKTKFNEIEQRV